MKSQMIINYNNGKRERYSFIFNENHPQGELQERMELAFDGKLLRLRVQDESLKDQDRLLLIPFSSIQSLSLDLPITEFRLPNVIYVNPELDDT